MAITSASSKPSSISSLLPTAPHVHIPSPTTTTTPARTTTTPERTTTTTITTVPRTIIEGPRHVDFARGSGVPGYVSPVGWGSGGGSSSAGSSPPPSSPSGAPLTPVSFKPSMPPTQGPSTTTTPATPSINYATLGAAATYKSPTAGYTPYLVKGVNESDAAFNARAAALGRAQEAVTIEGTKTGGMAGVASGSDIKAKETLNVIQNSANLAQNIKINKEYQNAYNTSYQSWLKAGFSPSNANLNAIENVKNQLQTQEYLKTSEKQPASTARTTDGNFIKDYITNPIADNLVERLNEIATVGNFVAKGYNNYIAPIIGVTLGLTQKTSDFIEPTIKPVVGVVGKLTNKVYEDVIKPSGEFFYNERIAPAVIAIEKSGSYVYKQAIEPAIGVTVNVAQGVSDIEATGIKNVYNFAEPKIVSAYSTSSQAIGQAGLMLLNTAQGVSDIEATGIKNVYNFAEPAIKSVADSQLMNVMFKTTQDVSNIATTGIKTVVGAEIILNTLTSPSNIGLPVDTDIVAGLATHKELESEATEINKLLSDLQQYSKDYSINAKTEIDAYNSAITAGDVDATNQAKIRLDELNQGYKDLYSKAQRRIGELGGTLATGDSGIIYNEPMVGTGYYDYTGEQYKVPLSSVTNRGVISYSFEKILQPFEFAYYELAKAGYAAGKSLNIPGILSGETVFGGGGLDITTKYTWDIQNGIPVIVPNPEYGKTTVVGFTAREIGQSAKLAIELSLFKVSPGLFPTLVGAKVAEAQVFGGKYGGPTSALEYIKQNPLEVAAAAAIGGTLAYQYFIKPEIGIKYILPENRTGLTRANVQKGYIDIVTTKFREDLLNIGEKYNIETLQNLGKPLYTAKEYYSVIGKGLIPEEELSKWYETLGKERSIINPMRYISGKYVYGEQFATEQGITNFLKGYKVTFIRSLTPEGLEYSSVAKGLGTSDMDLQLSQTIKTVDIGGGIKVASSPKYDALLTDINNQGNVYIIRPSIYYPKQVSYFSAENVPYGFKTAGLLSKYPIVVEETMDITTNINDLLKSEYPSSTIQGIGGYKITPLIKGNVYQGTSGDIYYTPRAELGKTVEGFKVALSQTTDGITNQFTEFITKLPTTKAGQIKVQFQQAFPEIKTDIKEPYLLNVNHQTGEIIVGMREIRTIETPYSRPIIRYYPSTESGARAIVEDIEMDMITPKSELKILPGTFKSTEQILRTINSEAISRWNVVSTTETGGVQTNKIYDITFDTGINQQMAGISLRKVPTTINRIMKPFESSTKPLSPSSPSTSEITGKTIVEEKDKIIPTSGRVFPTSEQLSRVFEEPQYLGGTLKPIVTNAFLNFPTLSQIPVPVSTLIKSAPLLVQRPEIGLGLLTIPSLLSELNQVQLQQNLPQLKQQNIPQSQTLQIQQLRQQQIPQQQPQQQIQQIQILNPVIPQTSIVPPTSPIFEEPNWYGYTMLGVPERKKKQKQAIKQEKAYAVEIKRKGKFRVVQSNLTRGEALMRGSDITLKNLARTFRVVPTGKSKDIIGTTEGFIPSEIQFRTYRVKKGAKIPLTDTFIQKSSANLQSREEKYQIAEAKRMKKLIGF